MTVVAVVAIVAIPVPAVFAVAIAAVVSVLAVAIVVAILFLRHVDTVQDDAGVGNLSFVSQRVQHPDVRLRCVVGTYHIAADVGILDDLQRVGDEADGCGVENHVVVFLFQDVDDVAQILSGQQFCRVGWDRTCQHEVQVGIDARGLYVGMHIVCRDLCFDQQRTDTL